MKIAPIPSTIHIGGVGAATVPALCLLVEPLPLCRFLFGVRRLYISAHGAFGALVSLIFKITVKV